MRLYDGSWLHEAGENSVFTWRVNDWATRNLQYHCWNSSADDECDATVESLWRRSALCRVRWVRISAESNHRWRVQLEICNVMATARETLKQWSCIHWTNIRTMGDVCIESGSTPELVNNNRNCRMVEPPLDANFPALYVLPSGELVWPPAFKPHSTAGVSVGMWTYKPTMLPFFDIRPNEEKCRPDLINKLKILRNPT